MSRPSIRELGLKGFLDSTTDAHHDLNYHTFLLFMRKRAKIGARARAFNVSRATFYTWLAEYYREQEQFDITDDV